VVPSPHVRLTIPLGSRFLLKLARRNLPFGNERIIPTTTADKTCQSLGSDDPGIGPDRNICVVENLQLNKERTLFRVAIDVGTWTSRSVG